MLLFDLDGTLIDSNGVWLQVDIDFLARRGIPWSEEYNEGVAHVTLAAGAVFTKEYLRLPDSPEEIMEEWLSMVRHAYAETIPLCPGVREYLAWQASAGERMAVYTSCDRTLCEAALGHHGLGRYFETVFYAAELGVQKQSPEGFRRVAELLGAAPGEITFFDDSPRSCVGAKAAGLNVVGVYSPFFAREAEDMRRLCDRYVTGFPELMREG